MLEHVHTFLSTSYSAVSLELGAGVDGKYLVVYEGLTNSRMLTSVRTRPRTT